MIILAIVGTRVLACPGDRTRVFRRVAWSLDRLRPDVVISGGAKGVDSIAELQARVAGYCEQDGTLVIYKPEVYRFAGPGGFAERDLEMARDCTHLLRIHCQQATTYGSGTTAEAARKLGKDVVSWRVCDGLVA